MKERKHRWDMFDENLSRDAWSEPEETSYTKREYGQPEYPLYTQ